MALQGSQNNETQSPLVIICPARSGSKLLRSILYSSGDFSGRPYDINYVWKYGNYHLNHDQVSPSDVTQYQAEKIRNYFRKICEHDGSPRLLEKTVSNSLRVSFVKHIFPDAKIIHLYRDAFATVNSTMMCWKDDATSERIQSRQDRRRKLLEFPFLMAWPYLAEYLKTYAKKRFLGYDYADSWGPRYIGIDEDVRNRDLSEVCAKQWAKCIQQSVNALTSLTHGEDYINIAYEDLLANPDGEVKRIAEFAEITGAENAINHAQEVIDPNRSNPARYRKTELNETALQTIREGEERLQTLINKQP